MGESQAAQWDGRSRGGRLGYQFFVWVLRTFGVGVAYFFLAFVVVYFIPFAPRATRAVWRYHRSRRGLGVARAAAAVYFHYYVFGQTLIDKIAMRAVGADGYKYEFDNLDRFWALHGDGGGVVFIGAHVGCWEAGAAFFGTIGRTMNIVKKDAEHKGIKEVLALSGRGQQEYRVIALNDDPLEAVVAMKLALDRGEYVCFNGDRYMREENVRLVDFLGSKALFPLGPFVVANKCRVPVVFFYAMRERGRRYRFVFVESEAAQRVEDLQEQYVRSLESVVRRYPYQWFNFYDFWSVANA